MQSPLSISLFEWGELGVLCGGVEAAMTQKTPLPVRQKYSYVFALNLESSLAPLGCVTTARIVPI